MICDTFEAEVAHRSLKLRQFGGGSPPNAHWTSAPHGLEEFNRSFGRNYEDWLRLGSMFTSLIYPIPPQISQFIHRFRVQNRRAQGMLKQFWSRQLAYLPCFPFTTKIDYTEFAASIFSKTTVHRQLCSSQRGAKCNVQNRASQVTQNAKCKAFLESGSAAEWLFAPSAGRRILDSTVKCQA